MNAAEKARIAREQAEKEEEINKSKNEEKEAFERVKEQVQEISTSKKWSTVKFGKYYKDAGKEPIEWLVLENFGDEITLVSKYVLDCYDFYHDSERSYKQVISWDISDIREWLNHEFLDKAFSKNEQKFIMKKDIDSLRCGNGIYNSSFENIDTTTDKVYLLSRMDLKRGKTLFGNKLKKCKPTKYALSKSVVGKNNCLWWLRDTEEICYVRGYIGYTGEYVYSGGPRKYICVSNPGMRKFLSKEKRRRVGVRPVITLKIED